MIRSSIVGLTLVLVFAPGCVATRDYLIAPSAYDRAINAGYSYAAPARRDDRECLGRRAPEWCAVGVRSDSLDRSSPVQVDPFLLRVHTQRRDPRRTAALILAIGGVALGTVGAIGIANPGGSSARPGGCVDCSGQLGLAAFAALGVGIAALVTGGMLALISVVSPPQEVSRRQLPDAVE